jgi:toxin ParE1/3/4
MVVRLHDEADAEFIDAALFYAERSPDVSDAFISAVEEALDQIARMPRSAPAWPGRPDVRRRVLTRYPYAIVYLLERDEIFIVAVEHVKRRPGYWLGRLSR